MKHLRGYLTGQTQWYIFLSVLIILIKLLMSSINKPIERIVYEEATLYNP
jgi:hypothetical protein